MAGGDSSMVPLEQLCHGGAHDFAPAQHHCVGTLDLSTRSEEHVFKVCETSVVGIQVVTYNNICMCRFEYTTEGNANTNS